jgi:hypothetical protein
VLHATNGGASLSDEAVEAIASYGDEAGDAVTGLSDDALEGMGEVADDAGENGIRSLDEGLSCVIGAVSLTKPSHLGKPVHTVASNDTEQCKQLRELAYRLVGEAAEEWSDETLKGLGHIVDNVGESAARRLIDLGNNFSQEAFGIVARRGNIVWDGDTVEGLALVFEKAGGAATGVIDEYADNVVQNVLQTSARNSSALDNFDQVDDMFQLERGSALNDAIAAGSEFNTRNFPMGTPERAHIENMVDTHWGTGLSQTEYAEAIGAETAVAWFEADYDILYVQGRAGVPGTHGPDIIATHKTTGEVLIIEAKGTASGTALTGGWVTTSAGVELSDSWLRTDPQRYLDVLDQNFPTAAQAVRGVLFNGDTYQTALVYAGRDVSYGGGLANFFSAAAPDVMVKVELPR